MHRWRDDRIGSALRGGNPTILTRLDTAETAATDLSRISTQLQDIIGAFRYRPWPDSLPAPGSSSEIAY
ncbi:hypothetical protein Acy02nite_83270 [Actinoplanes cyaneus]|uniref:Uncharacterized protein n=1 Tax=Actinoplanes cyaneus TaxID=52696 RepID=A0A919MGP1_9ACTN|nr:hypothetical protein [Actinoplanes cyaneus]MCW2143114.1 hypothetical protein [Actinoplanes cyaneus]GID70446.1 hypothetical protein Acy02nite_83270 [Actinoplanes cyaneus]